MKTHLFQRSTSRHADSVSSGSSRSGSAVTSSSSLSSPIDRHWLSKSSSSTSAVGQAVPVSSIGQSLRDIGLKSIATTRSTDGSLDRKDMLSLFRSAKDGGQVDRSEFRDLRWLVSRGNSLGMPEYVQVLAKKVVIGDRANAWYTGGQDQATSLGNLKVGSSAIQLGKLVNKWFLGGDLPSPIDEDGYTYRYRRVNGELFQEGASYSDVAQGAVGNCYFLAGLAATAQRSPETIQNMFTDNGDGTFTVRFYQNGVADYVTVNRSLPTEFNYSAFADWGSSAISGSNELWVALAEKAYVQLNESGWSKQNGKNQYAGISAGYTRNAISQITGQATSWGFLGESNRDTIVNTFNSGKSVALNSDYYHTDAAVVSGHAYVMLGYDATTETFRLYNPWGEDGASIAGDSDRSDGEINLTWQQITSNFDSWDYLV